MMKTTRDSSLMFYLKSMQQKSRVFGRNNHKKNVICFEAEAIDLFTFISGVHSEEKMIFFVVG